MDGYDGEGEVTDEALAPHAAIMAELHDYAASLALGGTVEARFRQIAAHLADCPACRASLDELLTFALPAYSGAVLPATRRPRWRVPRAAGAASERWRVDAAGRLLVQFSAALLVATQQSAIAAARGQERYRYEVQAEPVLPLRLTIEIAQDEADPTLAQVEVQVDIGTRGPLDQAGTRVVLRAGAQEWAEETDPTGFATFERIPGGDLPELRVEVTPTIGGGD